MKKLTLAILVLSSLIFSCTDNNEKFNSRPQAAFAGEWYYSLDDYSNAKNDIVSKQIEDRIYNFFKIEKECNQWRGKLSAMTADNSTTELVITQMLDEDNELDLTYTMEIGNDSKAYDEVKNISIGDFITFSGKTLNEKSFTKWGMMDAPEIVVECSRINGLMNTKPKPKTEYKSKFDNLSVCYTHATYHVSSEPCSQCVKDNFAKALKKSMGLPTNNYYTR